MKMQNVLLRTICVLVLFALSNCLTWAQTATAPRTIEVKYLNDKLFVQSASAPTPDSPLEILPNDEITEIGGASTSNYNRAQLQSILNGASRPITVARGTQRFAVNAVLTSAVAITDESRTAGTDALPAGGAIVTRLPTPPGRPRGNLAPYRKQVLTRIAQNWHPKRQVTLVVLITIGRDGTLLGAEIYEKSGNPKADAEALAAVRATEYPPLPDWVEQESVPFKIELSKVEAVEQY
jgi:TonB family protein